MSRRIRVGAVNYLNTKPLIYDLTSLAPEVELSLELPSRLADLLAWLPRPRLLGVPGLSGRRLLPRLLRRGGRLPGMLGRRLGLPLLRRLRLPGRFGLRVRRIAALVLAVPEPARVRIGVVAHPFNVIVGTVVSRLLARLCLRRQSSICPWCPESRTSGTFQPRNSAGLV